jgi:MinD superfamily P-loop ATPase
MKQIVILSGKGGTGKTTVAAALAHLAAQERSLVLADADVDAANLELLLTPQVQETHDFVGGKVAVIDPEHCTRCGRCVEVCRFGAVSDHAIDPVACEGCATCYYQCPSEAIRLVEPRAGEWFRSQTRFGPLFHAQLFAGQENSGKLVTQVKQQARLLARKEGADYLIVDGPPGIGCPVIASLSGEDLALLVTEPTVAGAHDLERILDLARYFRVLTVICINKHDLSAAQSREIETYASGQGIKVIGRIPFDSVVTAAMVQAVPVTEYSDGPVAEELRQVWARVRRMGD